MKLSKSFVAKATYKGKANTQDIRWDSAVPGFGLRIYPTGRKSFVLRYREAGGTRKIIVLGTTEDLSLVEARLKAQELLFKTKTGTIPTQTLRQSVKGVLFGELADEFMSRHTPKLRSGDQDNARIQRHLLPLWKETRIQNITSEHLRELHARISQKGPIEANRTLALFSRMFNRGKLWRLIPPDLFNPADDVILHPERKRDRWVNPDEMPRLLTAIEEVSNPYVRAALWLYLLTGARKNEILQVKHTNLDHHTKSLRLSQTKNGQEHWLPLPEPAYHILASLPLKQSDPTNPHLFPGRNIGRPIVNLEKAWRRVKIDAGLPEITIHDLRRTMASWVVQNGSSIELVGALLNHSDHKSTMVYARFGNQSMRAALEEYATRLMEISGGIPELTDED